MAKSANKGKKGSAGGKQSKQNQGNATAKKAKNGYDVKRVSLVAIARDGDERDVKVHTEVINLLIIFNFD